MKLNKVKSIPILKKTKVVGKLELIDNPSSKEYELLKNWRNKNQRWFNDKKPVTLESTRIWWQTVEKNPHRVLYWVINTNGKIIGHMGLNRFKNNSCELDNVIRGIKTSPGLMSLAVSNLIDWTYKSLPIKNIYLQTNHDNLHAINFYQKCAFTTIKNTRPLIKMQHIPPVSLSGFDKLTVSNIPKKSRILDLGCADGNIGYYLQHHLNCDVVGVEKNQKLVNEAVKKLNTVIQGDIESRKTQQTILNLPSFDVILCSAILEHLQNPEVFIKNIKTKLNKDGFIIITLPNIAFWQIRLNLLFGSFQYVDSGILDRTHLKFFTVKTASHFIKKGCNLKIKTIDYDFPQIPILSKFLRFLKLLEIQKKILERFPNIFAYQILFIAKPNED